MRRQGSVDVLRTANTSVELGESHRRHDNIALQPRRRLEQIMNLAACGMVCLDECLHSLGIEYRATHRRDRRATA